MSTPNHSPFKFLDAFQRKDAHLYFGREREVEELYELTFDARLIVFFGASGTGKTSLVQCGLANKFPPSRWKELYVRRDGDINASLLRRINEALVQAGGTSATDPITALEQLHRHTYTPAYLIFDQLEELFILQPDKAEKEAFFNFLQRFLNSPMAAKAILVMREEFIAHLWDWEHLAPSLFDHRYRITHLEQETMHGIVERTLTQLEQEGQLQVEQPALIAERVWDKLADGHSGTSLTNLQVFLDRLYRLAAKAAKQPPLLTPALAKGMKNIDDLFDDFLEEELQKLEAWLGKGREGVPLRLLAAFVSDEQTKKVLEVENLSELRGRYGLTETELEHCLQTFVDKIRILKSYEL